MSPHNSTYFFLWQSFKGETPLINTVQQAVCYGFTYHTSAMANSSITHCDFYFLNYAAEHVGMDGCEKFMDYLKRAVADVPNAQLKFTYDFDYPASKELKDKLCRINGRRYEEQTPVLKFTIDLTKTGNIAYYWFGAVMRCFQNAPRVILNFLRIAEMKFEDTTLIGKWGFLNVFHLAHILKLSKVETDFKGYPCENYIPSHIKYLNNVSLSYYLNNNKPFIGSDNYRNDLDGNIRYISNSYVSSVPDWQFDIEKPYGYYWDETMGPDIIYEIFSQGKELA